MDTCEVQILVLCIVTGVNKQVCTLGRINIYAKSVGKDTSLHVVFILCLFSQF